MITDKYGQPYPTNHFAPEEQWAAGRSLTEGSIFTKLLPFHQENVQLPNPLDFNQLIHRFYRKNAIVYSAVRLLSGSASDPEIQAGTVDRKGVFVPAEESDALSILMKNPNAAQDAYEFMEQLLIHLFTAGNAFVHFIRSKKGNVVEMELIRPDIVSIIPRKAPTDKRIVNYVVESDGNKISVPAEDMLQFKLPDSLDEFWGLSPLFVLARLGDIDDQSVDFLRAFFLNKGVPSGMLTVAGRIQDPDREALKASWQEQFTGQEGWHKVPVMDQNVQFQQLSTGLKDMDLNPIFNQTETRIAMVYGVPPILLGTNAGLERSTFSNFKESRRGFWQETLVPLYTRLERRFTRMLAQREFGDNRAIRFNLEKVAGLQQSQQELRQFSIEGWRRGLLTRDDALKLVDMDPSEFNGDSVLMSTSQLYVPLEQAVQFADLVGDVVSDVVQEEIAEGQDPAKVAGIGDPSPKVGGKDNPANRPKRKPPVAVVRASFAPTGFGLDEFVNWYRKNSTLQTETTWDENTGDCVLHSIFACGHCQERFFHAEVVRDALNGDRDAEIAYYLYFPPEFGPALTELMLDSQSRLNNIENAVTVFELAIGEQLATISAFLDLAVFCESQRKTPDECRVVLFNAKLAVRNKNDSD